MNTTARSFLCWTLNGGRSRRIWRNSLSKAANSLGWSSHSSRSVKPRISAAFSPRSARKYESRRLRTRMDFPTYRTRSPGPIIR
jgi:hypothetical protein